MARLKNLSIYLNEDGDIVFTIHFDRNSQSVSEVFSVRDVRDSLLPAIQRLLEEDTQRIKEIQALKRNAEAIARRLKNLGADVDVVVKPVERVPPINSDLPPKGGVKLP